MFQRLLGSTLEGQGQQRSNFLMVHGEHKKCLSSYCFDCTEREVLKVAGKVIEIGIDTLVKLNTVWPVVK